MYRELLCFWYLFFAICLVVCLSESNINYVAPSSVGWRRILQVHWNYPKKCEEEIGGQGMVNAAGFNC